MNNLALQSVKDIIHIKRGFAFRSEDYRSEGVPILRVSNIESDSHIDDKYIFLNVDFAKQYENYFVNSGDVLLVMVGATTGKLGFVAPKNVPALLNQNMWNLKPRENIDSGYLRYKCYEIIEGYLAVAQGSARDFLKQSDFEKYLVTIHKDLIEQKKIAKILTTVDNLIEQTQALIDKYTAIKQGMMADLFTRGIDLSGTPETNPNHGQLRPSFDGAPELYKETELGWVPQEWDVLTIRDVATKVTDGDHHTPERSVEGVLLLSARNIHNGYLDLRNVDYVPEQEYARMINRCHPEPGDILISCSGTIGRVCEVPRDILFSLVRSVALVKLDIEKISTRYAEWFLRHEKSGRAMHDSALQAAQPNLFQSAIQALPLLLPQISEQKQIAERLDKFESLIRLEREAVTKYNKIKKGLMQDLLTGKVQVTV